jgi:hypothetical protein
MRSSYIEGNNDSNYTMSIAYLLEDMGKGAERVDISRGPHFPIS